MRKALAVTMVLMMGMLFAPEGAVAAKKFRFVRGVAAGDAGAKSVLLWGQANKGGPVIAHVSANRRFTKIVKTKRTRARAANNFTFEVPVGGLKSGKNYWYRFLHPRSGRTSKVGRFQTAPSGTPVEFVYSGDSDTTKTDGENFRDEVAQVLGSMKAENADFAAWLGDTIYADSSLRDAPATTLNEYRGAHKQARSLREVRQLLGSTSVVAQWDDHEVVNDYSPGNAPFDPTLGDKIINGQRAFLEYFPVGQNPDGSTWRMLDWGSDLEVFVLDERSFRDATVPIFVACDQDPGEGISPDLAPTLPQVYRNQFVPFAPYFAGPPPPGCLDAIRNPARTMLGADQKAALLDWLSNSSATFKAILSETPIQQFYALPYDRWEGYEAERLEILNHIIGNDISGVFFASTDTHATLGNVACTQTHDPDTGAYVCDRDVSPWELVTGPMGTNTYAAEINAFLGAEGCAHGDPACPSSQVHAFLAGVVQVACINLNSISYGRVDVTSGAAPTLTANSRSPAAGGGADICTSDIVVTP